ncbi:MAG: hypothetical protein JW818_07670 [Pirellulales bacterium]|nr:hypothetical protein [Pirellulales bacterium]
MMADILPEDESQSRQGAKSACKDSAKRITQSLLDHVSAIAEACGAAAVFVYVDALEGGRLLLASEIQPRAYYLTKTLKEQEQQEARGAKFIRVPNVPLTV